MYQSTIFSGTFPFLWGGGHFPPSSAQEPRKRQPRDFNKSRSCTPFRIYNLQIVFAVI